jgi:integrase
MRANEVVSVKVGDIDSTRMVIRVEQGEWRKDRYVMLSSNLLELLRACWRAARPQSWLFTDHNRVIRSRRASSTASRFQRARPDPISRARFCFMDDGAAAGFRASTRLQV